MRPLTGHIPSLVLSHVPCPSKAQFQKSWQTSEPLHDRTYVPTKAFTRGPALGGLSSSSMGSYAGCKSPQSLRNGTCTLTRALSRGFSARSPLTTTCGLICGLQQSMVALSYGLVCHDFWLPVLDSHSHSQHQAGQAPYSIQIRLRIQTLQAQLTAWSGRESRPQAPLVSH